MAEPKQGQETKNQMIERLTEESAQRGFIEFPKMLHHTDGSNTIVNNKDEEAEVLASGNFHPNPALAQAAKAKRDEADRKKAALAIGKEAAAKNAKNGE